MAGDNDLRRVLLQQARQADELQRQQAELRKGADESIASAEALLRSLGVAPPERTLVAMPSRAAIPPRLRAWSDILAEAVASTPENVSLSEVLTPAEIRSVDERHRGFEREFTRLHALDMFDWTISGAAGVLGALVDIFLVQVPKHPGFLGGAAHEGGWLSNAVKGSFGRVLPEEKIRSLERQYRVSYDASTSRGLGVAVPGLGPNTHRLQSLGHDPLLAWIFGVRDLLTGKFTAIGKDGRLIVQATAEPLLVGERLYVRLFEALRLVAGHLLSDVGTARGLPAPLMPLLLFLQHGKIGKHEYTIAELSRQMYRMGYDFRHFIASSVPVIVIEAVVRIAFFARALHEGKPLADAVPLASLPKLRSQLLIAHSVATAVNAGKVYVTQNPLGLNWPQWLAFFRYLLPQAHWVLVGAERERLRHVEARVEEGWQSIDVEHLRLWREVFGCAEPAVL